MGKQVGMTEEEANGFIEKYMDSKPNVEKFINDTHKFVEQNGYVTELHGFRRNLQGIWSSNSGTQSKALRQSVNTIIQGTGGALTNMALGIIRKIFELYHMKSLIVLTVHDSIVVDSPADEVLQASELALYAMKNLPLDWLYIDYKGEHTRYPIDAEAEIGLTYNDMVELDPADYKTFESPTGYCQYYMKKRDLDDYVDSGEITQEEYDTKVAEWEQAKPTYQKIKSQALS